MKKTLIAAFFIFLISNLSAGYLRVKQLGIGWLVPDDIVDYHYNPAKMMDVERKQIDLTVQGRTSEQEYYDDDPDTNVTNDFNISPGIKILSEIAMFKIAIGLNTYFTRYVSKWNYAYSIEPQISSYTDHYETVECALAMKLEENVDIGVLIGKWLDLGHDMHAESIVDNILLGINIRLENWDLGIGVKVEMGKYQGYYGDKTELTGGLVINPEIKLDDNFILRAYNEFLYTTAGFDDIFGVPNPDSYVFGQTRFRDIFGAGMILKMDESIFSTGVYMNYLLLSEEKNPAYYGVSEYGNSQFLIKSYLAFETKLFVKWIKFRFNYQWLYGNKVKIQRNDYYGKSEEERNYLRIFPRAFPVVGLQFILTDSMNIDVSVDGTGLYSYEDSKYSDYYYESNRNYTSSEINLSINWKF